MRKENSNLDDISVTSYSQGMYGILAPLKLDKTTKDDQTTEESRQDSSNTQINEKSTVQKVTEAVQSKQGGNDREEGGFQI